MSKVKDSTLSEPSPSAKLKLPALLRGTFWPLSISPSVSSAFNFQFRKASLRRQIFYIFFGVSWPWVSWPSMTYLLLSSTTMMQYIIKAADFGPIS